VLPLGGEEPLSGANQKNRHVKREVGQKGLHRGEVEEGGKEGGEATRLPGFFNLVAGGRVVGKNRAL